MDVTSIYVEAGFTMNAGDYQSVKATVGMKADLARGETVEEATTALKRLVMSNLISTATDAHPEAARKLLGKPQLAAPAQETLGKAETVEEKAKRTRRTKEQIAADEAAAAKAKAQNGTAKLAETDPGNKLLSDEDAMLGGDADEGLGGDADDLLGGEETIEVTRELLMEKLREVVKSKGSSQLASLFKKVGSADLKSTPTNKYQELYAAALTALAS